MRNVEKIKAKVKEMEKLIADGYGKAEARNKVKLSGSQYYAYMKLIGKQRHPRRKGSELVIFPETQAERMVTNSKIAVFYGYPKEIAELVRILQ